MRNVWISRFGIEKTTLLSVFCLSLLLFGSDARAQWIMSNPAITCSVSGIDQGIVAKTHGKVYFRDKSTGGIVLFCRVPETFDRKWLGHVILKAIDSTGRGDASGKVSASLRRMDVHTGHVSDVAGTKVSTENGCSSIPGNDILSCQKSVSNTRIDFSNHFYYIQINLDRASDAQRVQVLGLILGLQPGPS